ncbi:phage tail protein [Erwinia endophytica]|nr:phage tail protein [Erwinia endophytica]
MTQSEYNELMQGRNDGNIIIADDNGGPVLTEPVVNWQERAESQSQILLAEANSIIEDWRTELQLDMISDNNKGHLIKWMVYIQKLKELDFTSTVDELSYEAIAWPEKPI